MAMEPEPAPISRRERFAHGDSDEAVFRTDLKRRGGHVDAGILLQRASDLAIGDASARACHRSRRGADERESASRRRCLLGQLLPLSFRAGEGGLTGPDLTTIGSQRSYSEFRESLLDPDAQVDSPYWSVAAVTSNGKSIRGLRLNEDSFSSRSATTRAACSRCSSAT